MRPMAKLCIAEKPSLARSIASAVGARRRDGESYVGGGWRVCWAHGHIVDLASPESYEGAGWGPSWRENRLPIAPERFLWEASTEDGSSELLERICRWIDDPATDVIVHAGDPDREGEGIVRRILKLHPTDKPVLRLWSSSAEPEAIREAASHMRPDADYDRLGDAAEGRAVADWLIGLNATRSLSRSYGRTVHSGRVSAVILRLIVERTRAHDDFTKVSFWQVRVVCGGMRLEGPRLTSREEAEAMRAAIEADGAVRIASVTRRRKRAKPPAPYNLDGLQKDASRLLGMGLSRSLDACQALYEAGLQTYPRTESTAIAEGDLGGARAVLTGAEAEAILGAEAVAAARGAGMDPTRLVDDAAVVGGHPALMPTRKLTREAYAALDGDRRDVARLVMARLLAASCSVPSVRASTKVEAVCAGQPLTASATELVDAGWEAVRELTTPKRRKPDCTDSNSIPHVLSAGNVIAIAETEIHEGTTEPPALYTDDTLLSALSGADRLVAAADLKAALKETSTHSGGIGTPATRTRQLEQLIERGYVASEKGRLKATELGVWADSLTPAALTTPELTARWEAMLADVEDGKMALGSFISYARSFAQVLVSEIESTIDPSKIRRDGFASPGPCPKCGAPMRINRAGTSAWCSSRAWNAATGEVVEEGCGYRFSTTVRGHRLSASEVTRLLARGQVTLTLKKKDGTGTYRAVVRTDVDNPYGTSIELAQDAGASSGAKRGSSGRARKAAKGRGRR